MRKKTKTALIIIAAVLTVIIFTVSGFNIYFSVLNKQPQIGSSVGYDWSGDDLYEDKYTTEIAYKEDFKILVLTDIHIDNHGTFGAFLGVNYILDFASEIALKKLIKKTAPDLIIVLGDTVLTQRNDLAYRRFVNFIDGFKIKWACVFGNHDDEGRADKSKIVDIIKTSKYGIFEFGPKDMHGAGNYVIRLTENEKTKYALYFMDSGNSLEFDEKKDGINEKQVTWFEWVQKGIEQKEGSMPNSMSFFHIPLPQYNDLDTYMQGNKNETISKPSLDGGLFKSMKKNKGTHIFVGHDHNNNFIGEIDGVKLAYGTKSSYNCYFKSKVTGGTLLTVAKDNSVTEEIVLF